MKKSTLKTIIREDASDDVQDLIANISNYEEFVSKLGELASDSKVRAFLKSGRADGDIYDDKFTAIEKAIDVVNLRPTQNEIDVDGSLKWPLTKPESVRNCLQKGPVTIKAPVVTYNGQYIIDGHHRWSQLYAMNKEGKINCIDLTGPNLNPIDVLKVVQLAIAADTGRVPVATVKGNNLLKLNGKEIAEYVIKTITDECVGVFNTYRGKSLGKLDKNNIAGKIVVPNVMEMQKTSQPVSGAPKRDVMPQTDDATNALTMIDKGVINFNKPYTPEHYQKQIYNVLNTNKMKKSTLKTIIREEIKKVLIEVDVIPVGPDGNKVTDKNAIRNLNMALKSVNSSIRPKLIALISDSDAAKALTNPAQKAAVIGAIAIAFGITEKDFSQIVTKIKSVLKTSEPNA
jgi:hypothetical protein